MQALLRIGTEFRGEVVLQENPAHVRLIQWHACRRV